MIHAIVVRLDDHDVAVLVDAHAFRVPESGLRHLPEQNELSAWIELLHARRHIHGVEIVVAIDHDSARLGEPADANTFAANDLDAAEKAALELGRRGRGVTASQREYGHKDEG